LDIKGGVEAPLGGHVGQTPTTHNFHEQYSNT
jgi:hypothetical protein